MCGLVGLITKKVWGFDKLQADLFSHMLYCDALRGFDSTGAFMVNKYGNVKWTKSKFNPVVLLNNKTYQSISQDAIKDGRVMVGHNRKATHGTVTDENAHPFVEDNIILVHNGVIYDHKKHADTEVDSHAICKLIKEKGHHEALKAINGAFALIWYNIDTKTLHLARNDKRPLWLIETTDEYLVASEKDLLLWMISRNTLKIKETIEIEKDHIYTFDIEDVKKFKKEKFEGYTPPKTFPTEVVSDIFRGSSRKSRTGNTRGGTDLVPHKPKDGMEVAIPDAFQFEIGQQIVFMLEDYSDRESIHNKQYDGIIHGFVADNPAIRVQVYFMDDDWLKISDDNLIAGELLRFSVYEGITTLWLKPGSLKTAWLLKSVNNIEVTNQLWEELPHKCTKCNDVIAFFEVDDCIIHEKPNKKHKIYCPQCTTNILLDTNGKGIVNAH